MRRMQRLSECCDISMGQAPSGEAYNANGNGWPLIAGAGDFGDLYPNAKKYTTEASRLSKHGDIILGIRATIGEKVIADGEYCLGRGVAGLRTKEGLDSRYLWHWLTHIKPILATKAKGATFKQVNKEDIGELAISLPPLPEQRRIAAILDHADTLRAKRREALAQLDSLTQSIFIDMFGDPLTNPHDTRVVRLSEITTRITDGVHQKPNYTDEGVPFISVKDITTGLLKFDGCKYISLEDHKKFTRRCKAEYLDILYTKVGATYGRPALVDTEREFSLYVSVCLIKPDRKLVDSHFLNAALGTAAIKKQADSRIKGIGVPDLHLDQIQNLLIPRPSMGKQRLFAERVATIQNQKNQHQQSLSEMDSLFASLQHRAFRGEL
ncbi:restriction endonuclease subunit S [Methylomicrobium lacus]|uniref:restriction endonuclease subunit S n=1 Tax=Methylomicrobium lacus TaxID=136992 RepID=UPI0004A31705|nr:restriction endonuclease subunit S [Methylomicrobium lacus]